MATSRRIRKQTPNLDIESPPYVVPVSEIQGMLETDLITGLSNDVILERQEKYGANVLNEKAPVPWWKKLLAQITELVILILIVAALISAFMGEWIDAIVILAIVILNALLGYFQEAQAESALASLRKLSVPLTRVTRNGQSQQIPAADIVPGDLIELEAGDRVPADLRLVQTFSFQTQEAALTGESVPVDKDAVSDLRKDTPLAERRNMAFMGTAAASGRARGVVVATGMTTELGHIATLIQSGESDPTPLQRRLAELGKTLVGVCLVLVVIVFFLQMYQGRALAEVFFLSVSLAVAAVPEGLPAIVTMALALGLKRMVKRNVIIRKLPSVETLGSVTVVCSDKTGTLTRNEMSVRVVSTFSNSYRITGSGYEPKGEFRKMSLPETLPEIDLGQLLSFWQSEELGDLVEAGKDSDLLQTLEIGYTCNNAKLIEKTETEASQWEVLGDPTEGALIVAAQKAGFDNPRVPIDEWPFDSDRKRMSVVVEGSEKPVLYCKGAPEALLDLCDRVLINGVVHEFTPDRRSKILLLCETLAGQALRTLAMGYRDNGERDSIEEENLIFAGLISMIDPPRVEVNESVKQCRDAGIRPVMITGDHPATAQAIARELGISTDDTAVTTGRILDTLSEEELDQRAAVTSVFARVTAEHKLRIVKSLKKQGEIVAMTGDGVNDAPALKHADIGIAMGITGTEVTKEASAMVLTDDNFSSIVSAVEEGRGIFDNIQKFILYLLSCNAGELIFVLVATLFGWPMPLLAIQILWINLVTDGFPALALGLEPPERDIMKRKPRNPREPVITWARGGQMLLYGTLIAAVTLVAFYVGVHDTENPGFELGRSLAFCTLSYSQLLFALSCRSQKYTMPQLGPLTNRALLVAIVFSASLQIGAVNLPYIGDVIFKMAPHRHEHWLIIGGLALIPVSLIELGKMLRQRLNETQ